MKRIKIKHSEDADTRTCKDVSQISKDQLLQITKQHIEDVNQGMRFFAKMLLKAGINHDYTKIDEIDQFYKGFQYNFKNPEWLERHRNIERHHISNNIPEDINLIDIIEYIVDGVVAGMGRSGTYQKEEIPKDILEKAFNNTINLLISNIKLIKQTN